MIKKNKDKLLIYAIGLTFAGFLFMHFYAPRFITEINNPIVGAIKRNYVSISYLDYQNQNLKGKYIKFQSFDQKEMTGYLTYSNLDTTKGTIILLHGIRSRKEHFAELSAKLSSLGFNSIALDLRAHGQSQGTHCTFGVKEKRDLSYLIDYLNTQENLHQNIGVWGQSLGGAVGLQALAYDDRIKFGIIESTFSDFRIIANDYVNYFAGFNIRPLTNYLVGRAGRIAGFNPTEARPLVACTKIDQPVLLVHGDIDKRISIQYAKANFDKIKSDRKSFLEVEGANHLSVWDVGGDEYFSQVLEFLNENTSLNN